MLALDLDAAEPGGASDRFDRRMRLVRRTALVLALAAGAVALAGARRSPFQENRMIRQTLRGLAASAGPAGPVPAPAPGEVATAVFALG